MDRCLKWTGLTLSLLTILSDPGFGASIIEGPQNQTVLVGSIARFNCTVSEGWNVLIWLFHGDPKLTVISNGTFYGSPPFSQKGHASGSTFTSELMIADVQLTDSGQVRCSIQNDQNNMYAYLSVQESGNDDARIRTIILAVVLPIVAILLVILIILLIVCCKRKKESDYQKEVKKNIAETKTTNRNLETITRSGNENYGYNPEEMYETVQMRGIVPVSPSIYGSNQDAYLKPPSEVLYNRYNDEALPSRPTTYPVHPRKIRNATHV